MLLVDYGKAFPVEASAEVKPHHLLSNPTQEPN
jgi:hypothetical protein